MPTCQMHWCLLILHIANGSTVPVKVKTTSGCPALRATRSLAWLCLADSLRAEFDIGAGSVQICLVQRVRFLSA